MDSSTFNQALRATARVACAVAVFGMAGSAEVFASEGERAPAQVSPLGDRAPAEHAPIRAEGLTRGPAGQEAPAAAEGQAQRAEAFTPGPVVCSIAQALGVAIPACTPWGPPVPPRFRRAPEAVGVA